MDCGYFGVSSKKEKAFPLIYWGLKGEQNRGHQSYGFLTSYYRWFHVKRGLDVIPKIRKRDIDEWIEELPGKKGIGSIRYTTSGGTNEESLIKGTQPIVLKDKKIKVGMAFNGGIVPTKELNEDIKSNFSDFFKPDCDLEYLARKFVIEYSKTKDIRESVKTCMKEVKGAYSVVALTNKVDFFNFRDIHGIKPASAGFDENKKICAVSSETVALDINGIPHEPEIKPGELAFISSEGLEREQLLPGKQKFCGFELSYFSSSLSKYRDKYVYQIREDFGRNLSSQYSDVVKSLNSILSSPDSGNDAAYGLHEASGKPWKRCVRRHRFVTERAFILLPNERYKTIDKKIDILGPVKGKVGPVDDSIVRGDTTRVLVQKLRNKGASEVHLFITFPKIIGPCFYGIDMATFGELIGSTREPYEIAKIIGADSVNYQSIDNFVKATPFRGDELCLGCVTGKYPTPLAQKIYDAAREEFDKGNEDKSKRIIDNFS